MMIKPGFEIKKISDRFIVIPSVESSINFTGIVTLNSSGKLLFEALKNDKTTNDLVILLTEKYEVTNEQALKDVNAFLEILKKHNLLT